ncbi:MAG: type I methionyl aminopeptidase [Candidatus Coprovivens sp.]
MIVTRTEDEIEKLRMAGKVVGLTHKYLQQFLKPGISTLELSLLAKKFILSKGCTCSFEGLYGFPGTICISINDEVVHGIPGNRRLKNGDIVKLDIGACYQGYHGDSAWSYIVGEPKSERDVKLLRWTEESLMAGLNAVKDGCTVGDIGHAVSKVAKKYNLGVVRELVGHGVGDKVHLAPDVPNYGTERKGAVLHTGNVIAIEPMLNAGSADIYMLDDDWTILTDDESNSAHFEHTVLVTDDGYEILTRRDIELDPEDIVEM